MKSKFKRILYGGDYNPNQWPEEIWAEDMRIFRDAHINSATINVFSWAKIQPSENVYDFSCLDKMIDMLSRENYDIVLATSTAALPAWMVKKYPEVMSTDYEGRQHHSKNASALLFIASYISVTVILIIKRIPNTKIMFSVHIITTLCSKTPAVRL